MGGRRKNRRGFTLVEMVISMALVVMVTLAVLTTAQVSFRTVQKNHVKQCAIREVENIITCFQSADFSAGLKLLYGETVPQLTIDADTVTGATVSFTVDGEAVAKDSSSAVWSVQATVTVSEDGKTETVQLTAQYLKNGDPIYSADYTRPIVPAGT